MPTNPSTPFIDPARHTRRAFLRRSAQLAATGTALPFALNLAALGEAAAFEANDYKALVCVFLYGGNDYANTVVPYDSARYAQYATIRGGGADGAAGGIALGRSALGGTVLQPASALAGGLQYALHPAMTGMAGLFNSGRAAVQLNVGPLVVPLTRAQYASADRRTYPLPPKLFSHNDQQSVWQSQGAEGSTVGWGGNLGDLALSANTNSLFTCISASGNAVFLSGDQALQYQISTSGAVPINGVKNNVYGSSAVRGVLSELVQAASTHAMEAEYARVTQRSIGSEGQISAALAGAGVSTAFPTGNPLADQLKVVARLIAARGALGTRRQVFFVSMGGFDLHDNLVSGQAVLMDRVSSAMTAFYNATVELGVADKVTAFTASDFGRTLTSNGDGSDHGWGSHHFVVGGAVRGAAFYGTPPPISVGNGSGSEDQWHVGQGRLLPSTAVDQYAATMARWFGVANTEMTGVLPRLGNFGGTAYPVNLGFLG
ncbi:DUF1501 domain-containing protein [Acidovorax sp. SUPP1855]|uniref:DUF1501 domain-containing protein n=1 Tax=Acidovorax sp. SUPP1855 TaxID=431774 RepID=UPI0023DE2B98|nr:DUF1501 domain-containing protein [Acidovorax sp. SUPP1855]GKS83062.1 DUF1501 domain-containing protein [Acidovorax sp. SUPP1855]